MTTLTLTYHPTRCLCWLLTDPRTNTEQRFRVSDDAFAWARSEGFRLRMPTMNTPGYKSRITIRIRADKNGQRRAHYWGMARRWLPLPLADAELFLAADQAWDHDSD